MIQEARGRGSEGGVMAGCQVTLSPQLPDGSCGYSSCGQPVAQPAPTAAWAKKALVMVSDHDFRVTQPCWAEQNTVSLGQQGFKANPDLLTQEDVCWGGVTAACNLQPSRTAELGCPANAAERTSKQSQTARQSAADC